jgi:hypothetical protein
MCGEHCFSLKAVVACNIGRTWAKPLSNKLMIIEDRVKSLVCVRCFPFTLSSSFVTQFQSWAGELLNLFLKVNPKSREFTNSFVRTDAKFTKQRYFQWPWSHWRGQRKSYWEKVIEEVIISYFLFLCFFHSSSIARKLSLRELAFDLFLQKSMNVS